MIKMIKVLLITYWNDKVNVIDRNIIYTISDDKADSCVIGMTNNQSVSIFISHLMPVYKVNEDDYQNWLIVI